MGRRYVVIYLAPRESFPYCSHKLPKALSLAPPSIPREPLEEGATQTFAQLKLNSSSALVAIADVSCVVTLETRAAMRFNAEASLS